MTRITRLVMHGFKSFAKRTEFTFGEDFSIILGPNGSGKSNVLDALCFVLGRMSSKSLRTEKLAHLIYNGGKKKEPANRAEVSIFFDNKEKVFPVDAAELKISRLIKASGQSVYKINDETRTRQQVLEVLSMARIDPDGHNIILQGDIVSFIEMSAENRRMLLEEVAGISVYEERKKKALSELERVGERLRESDILLSERKTHLKELKKDRDQALKFKDISDKIAQHRATHLHFQIEKRKDKQKELEAQIKEHTERIDKLKAEIEKNKELVVKKKQENQELIAEIEKRGEQDQVNLSKDIEQIRVDIGTARSKMEIASSELGKIVLRREQLHTDRKEIEEKVARLEKESGEIGARKKEQQDALAKIDRSIADLSSDQTLGSVTELEKEIDSIEKEMETQEQQTQQLTEKKQQLLRDKDRLEIQLQGIDEKVAKLKEIEKEHKQEVEELKQKQTRFKNVVVELNKELNHNSTLSASLGQLRKKYDALSEEVAKARGQHIAMQEQAAGSAAVRYITSQKIAGVHGTVSQLGTVPSKYALALEVAAGPRLNSVVVKDDAVAAKCIKELKREKLGTATFLPLNKIKGQPTPAEAKKKGAGIQGAAIELVKFDAQFHNVFSYVFGSTLVVDDIEAARRIGVGTVRMATLDGDLTEMSGAMHGGYRKSRGGAFQEKEAAQRVDKLERDVSAVQSDIADLETSKTKNEEAIARLREERATLEGEIIRTEKSLHLATGDAEASKEQEGGLKKQLADVDAQLEKMQQDVSARNSKLADIKLKRSQLRSKLGELRNPAVLAELNAFQAKRREIQDAIMRIESEQKGSSVQVEQVLRPELSKIENVLKQLDKDEERFTREKVQLDRDVAQKSEQLKGAEERSKKFRSKYQQLFEKRMQIGEEVQKLEEKIIRAEEGINVAEVRINSVAVKNAELAGELSGLNEEAQQYTDVKILKGVSEEQAKAEIARFERLAGQMGNVNMKALEVYDDVEKQYNELLDKRQKLESEKNDVVGLMDEIEGKKKELFMNTFNAVNEKFKKIFSELSVKGDAYLFLENEEKPFEAGLRVNVRITGNKFLDIRSLSGGEKTMTALAFIFAIQEYEPATFYILDEVDAALDKKNSEKLADLIKNYSATAQYIVISHNDNVISQGKTLYGVSMDENGMSNVVSLKM